MAGFDDEIADMTTDVIEDLGTSVALRLVDGREYAVSAVIDRQIQLGGDHGQVLGRRDVVTVVRGAIDKPPLGAVLDVSAGPYAGSYTVDSVEEDDATVWRLILREAA